MGKKIHPKIFRIQSLDDWSSRWFVRKGFPKLLQEDTAIKAYLKKKLRESFVAKIEIERTPKVITIFIHSARPGTIIGRGGTAVEDLKKEIKVKILKNRKVDLNINIKEIKDPNKNAALLAQEIVFSLEKRMPFRRAVKQIVSKAERAGVKGIKVRVSGRLNGVEIARSEKFTAGNLPLSTIRSDIDYAFEEANTTYGKIGIKVWVYKGEVFSKKKQSYVDSKERKT